MKKITLVTILAVGLSSAASMTANANDGAGFHTSLESGVKVYRGAPLQINHQAVASYKALELKERKIENQNRQAQAKLKSQNRIAQGRLDLDRRIAFTDNEIFSQRRSRFGGQRFVTGGFNRGFGARFNNNRFFGVNGISRNTRFSGGFGKSGNRFK